MTRVGPWVGKIPWRRAWPPLQYSCLENPVDRRAWWATVYRVAKSWTWLKWLSAYAHTHTQYNWINLSSLYILALLYFFFHSFQSCLVLLSILWFHFTSSIALSFILPFKIHISAAKPTIWNTAPCCCKYSAGTLWWNIPQITPLTLSKPLSLFNFYMFPNCQSMVTITAFFPILALNRQHSFR